MIEEKKSENKIELTELPEWKCFLFGGTEKFSGICWLPPKGEHPNFFWRWMQYIFFGNKWVKIKK